MAAPRPSGGPAPRSTQHAVALLLVAGVLIPAAMVTRELSVADDVPGATVVLVPLALGGLVVAGLVAHALGSSWWHNGAGHPVLQVEDGLVRGRLQPARRRAPAYDGWDFEVPVASLTGARLTASGHLTLGLPSPLEQELLERPDTRTHARQWRAVTGNAASWPASRMLDRGHRAEALDRLVAALSARIPPG